jgi:ferredoxin
MSAKVRVVENQCQGHGQCFIQCPSVFVPDDEGFVIPPEGEVAADLIADVRKAVDACPERALEFIEDYEGT